MRVTLHPDDDLLLPEGTTLADLRADLSDVTGRPALRTAPLTVDGTTLPEDHVVGVPPLVAGCTVVPRGATVPTTRPPARTEDRDDSPPPSATSRAGRSGAGRWTLLAVDGPDAGRTAPAVDPGGRLVVGRRDTPGGAATRRDGTLLGLADPAVSRRHAVVRSWRGRWSVRDLSSANGTTLHRTHRGRSTTCRVRRWRSLRPGDALAVGDSLLVLVGAPRPPARLLPALRHPTVLVALAGGLLVAAVTRNPVFLVLGLLGPLGMLATRAGAAGTARTPATTDAAHAAQPPSVGPVDVTSGGWAGVPDEAPPPDMPVVAGRLLLVDAVAALSGGRRGLATPGAPADGVGTAGTVGLPAWWSLARDGLAVVGSPGRATAVARALVLSALPAADLTALLGRDGWSWLRWAGPALTGPTGTRVARDVVGAEACLAATVDRPLLVLDVAGTSWRPALHRWFGRRRPVDATVLVVVPGAEPPAWCAWTLQVDGPVPVLVGPATRAAVTAPGLDERRVERAVRRWCAPVPVPTGPPDRVGWQDLALPRTADDVLRAWERPPPGLRARIGRTGPAPAPGVADHALAEVDLVVDGPHALVAGTTGAGKSELLQTLLLSLASTYPPDDLAVVLVDYKGGAGFGACAGLPHVTGMVTDLDEAGAARALAALRSELRRREHLLAAAGAADLAGLRASGRPAPPRLLVVVDEFRALVEDLPDLVPGLVRVATQGRSLGIHLVLATQRPAGVVDAQLRANLPLRICLRVADAADSLDVVEVPDAAHVPARLPGRAVVRCAGGPPRTVQTAWAPLAGAGRARVRRAPRWADTVHGGSAHGPEVGSVDDDDAVGRLVRAVGQAHRRTGRPAPEAPWLPPLPDLVDLAELADPPDGAVALGLVDRPAERRQELRRWAPDDGPLVVAGGPGSGRTSLLRSIAHQALAGGRPVHVLGAGAVPAWFDAHPHAGTWAGPADPARSARLLDRLLRGAGNALLLVDDVGALQQALALLPRGAGDGLVDRVLREGRLHRVGVAVCGAPADVVRHLPHAVLRLVLPVGDAHDARLLGATLPPGRQPGRGVVVGADGSWLCQVAHVASDQVPPTPTLRHPAGRDAAPVRLRPLPLRVPERDLGAAFALGGDAVAPVPVPTAAVLVVAGPAGSGRSTALAALAAAHRRAGRAVLTGSAALRAVEPATTAGTPERATGAGPGTVLLLDDLDVALRADPALDDRLEAWGAGGGLLVVSARTDRVAAAFRGVLSTARGSAALVLDVGQPGSAEVAGVELALHAEPGGSPPGRAVLVLAGRTTPVQVAVTGELS